MHHNLSNGMPTGYPAGITGRTKEAFVREYKHYLNKFYNPWSSAWQEPSRDGLEDVLRRGGQTAAVVSGVAAGGAAALSGAPAVVGAGGAMLRQAGPLMNAGSRARGMLGSVRSGWQAARSRLAGSMPRLRPVKPQTTAISQSTQPAAQAAAGPQSWMQRAKGWGVSGAKQLGGMAATGVALNMAGSLMGSGGGGDYAPDLPGMPTGYPDGIARYGNYEPGSNYDRLSKLHQRAARVRDLGGGAYLPTGKTPGAFR